MINKKSRNSMRVVRHERIRSKIMGTAEMPRLCVFRSNTGICRFLALCEGRDDPASQKGDHVHPAEALHADGNARRSRFVSGYRAFAEGVGSALCVLRTFPPDPAAGQRRRLEPYPLSG